MYKYALFGMYAISNPYSKYLCYLTLIRNIYAIYPLFEISMLFIPYRIAQL